MASSSRRKSGKGSSRKRTSSSQAAEPRKKKQKSTNEAAAPAEHEEPLFQVAKIVATKKGKNGVTLYKTRWEGYTPADDTWEPLEHVGSTGHVDRYERKQRELTLSNFTPGVAVIEYDDGERQTIDLLQEKFRSWMEISDDERDDDSVTGDDDVNNFDLIKPGAMIELLWPYAEIYFSCKVISWSPIEGNGIKKSAVKRHGSLVWDMKDNEAADAETDTRRKRINSAPLHGEGVCQTELKSGKESRRKHSDSCPAVKKSGGKDADRVRADRTYEKDAVDDKRNDSTTTQKKSSGSAVNETPKPTADVRKRYEDLQKKSLDKSKIPTIVGKARGIAIVPSGKWQLQYYYCGSARYIGIFKSKKDALIAYETVRQVLGNTNTENLSNQEISSNINLAKKLSEKRAKEAAAEEEVPIKKKNRSVEKDGTSHAKKGGASEAKGDRVHTKKRSRPGGDKSSAAEGKSDDASMKKKSRSSEEKCTEIAAKTKPQFHHALLKKTTAQGKKAENGERQNGAHVSNNNADTKKPSTHPAQMRYVPKDVSDDDNGDAIPSGVLKRNVSEEKSIDTSSSDPASKQLASTQTVGCTESLPDDMDIDALAALVSMRRSQATASSATDKHDDNSQAALKGDDDSHLESDSNKKPAAKPKVGRGIPLYSDHEYDTSDDEWRGEKEFFQAASHPRDGPKKLSFEEMWMMKLQQTQQIMDRNSGCRRW